MPRIADGKGGLVLQRNGKNATTHGFLVSVEVEEGTDINLVTNRLGEGIMWIEGVGEIDVHHLGEVEVIAEQIEEELDNEFLRGDINVGKKEMN